MNVILDLGICKQRYMENFALTTSNIQCGNNTLTFTQNLDLTKIKNIVIKRPPMGASYSAQLSNAPSGVKTIYRQESQDTIVNRKQKFSR